MRSVILAVGVLAASCGETPMDEPCSSDAEITVQSMTPPPGTPVVAGQTLTVDTLFAFETCHQARVTAHAWDGERTVPTVPDATGAIPNTELAAGHGTARLIAAMTVPTGRPALRFDLRMSYIGGARGATWPVFSATYPIAD